MQTENREKYEPASKIRSSFGVSIYTLRKWADENKIKSIRMPGGKRLYSIQDVSRLFEIEDRARKNVCYARVSSPKQREDLDRQVLELMNHYPSHELVKDIGSALNWKRAGFLDVMDRVLEDKIGEIVILYKDRLCRFGFEFVEWVCKKHDTRIRIHDGSSKGDNQRELADDLLAVTNYFVAKNNGLRAANNRKRRHEVLNTPDNADS